LPLRCFTSRPKASKPSATTAPTPTKPVAKPRSSPTASSVLRNLPPISNLQFQISNPLSSSSPRLRSNPPATCAPVKTQDSKTQEPRQESAISSAKFRGTRMNRL
jgi:hypothetical protein